ncbi:hypothetical protein UFOVP392_8 [uncultured Caudovirales phage]|jgi:hypothetical protein|uniref:Uncharacterized protein n=1 Tax=uncultured Caudovirales phage TaxID=2100421 RepID=A0A6J7X8R6_9CAUD|nr:hypothetical protein UFOVP392_8 [uncultured Caudovirales phage]
MARYKNTGEYNFKYPLRRRVANTLKKVIKDEGLIDTYTLYDSVRINAKVTTEGNIRVEILAAYYFGYLNNGTATIVPFRLVKKFNDALEKNGLIGEMYGMYVADLAQKFPILQLGNLLRRRPKVIYDFVPLYGEFNYALDY